MVALAVLSSVAVIIAQVRALLVVDDPWWRGAAVDPWTPLAFAIFAGFLAVFLSWRASDGPAARSAAFALAFSALWLALLGVPDGGRPAPLHGVAYALSWVGFFWFLRFTMLFPRELTVDDLAPFPENGASWTRPATWVRALQRMLLARPPLLWVLALATLAPLAVAMTGPAASRAYLLPPTRMVSPSHLSVALVALLLAGLGASFLRLGFGAADEEGRRRLRWLVLSWVALFFWATFGVALAALSLALDVPSGHPLTRPFWMAYYPGSWFLLFTGLAMAVFRSGAFDVRPLIGRTTVYGALVVGLTFMFVGVEELVEAQLVRVGVGEGAGTWLGAGVIAVAIGPLKARLERAVAKMAELEAEEPTAGRPLPPLSAPRDA